VAEEYALLRGDRVRRLRAAGVRVEAALPVGPIRALFVRADLRLHRKLVIVDGRIGYTGSMNLVDPHVFKRDAGFGEWVDAMVRVEGPPVAALETVFLEDWLAETERLWSLQLLAFKAHIERDAS